MIKKSEEKGSFKEMETPTDKTRFPAKQPGGCRVKITPENWKAVHGNDPLSIYDLSGRNRPFRGEEWWKALPQGMKDLCTDSVLGRHGTVSTNKEEPCEQCQSARFVVIKTQIHPGYVMCLCCGMQQEEVDKNEPKFIESNV